MDAKYLLDIGLIILFVRFFNIITEKIKFPKVVGSLLAGVVLGPAILNLVQPTKELDLLANISIIFIMFLAGMQTKLKKFISGTRKFAVIAFLGVFFPLGCGILVSNLYTSDPSINLFFGLVLTISSVSITIESLIELKKLKTGIGTAILGAGVIDDLIGIVLLTLIQNKDSLSFIMILKLILDFILFTILAVIIGFIMYFIFKLISKKEHDYIPNYALAYALLLAFIAEYFNISGVIGAYIAGTVMGTTKNASYTKNHIEDFVYLFFNPIFFASIGLKLTTLSLSKTVWIFIIIYTLVSIIDKLLGCGLGANLCGYNKKESFQIGIGMAARGEVSLIIANICLDMGIINSEIFTITIITIVLATLISPLILSLTFDKEKTKKEDSQPIQTT